MSTTMMSARAFVRPAGPAVEDEALHEWLELGVAEPPLDPSLAIVDCHHHLWDARAGKGGAHVSHGPGSSTGSGGTDPADPAYGAPNPAGCQQRYLLEDVLADIQRSGRNVVQTVFVECGSMFDEAAEQQAHLAPAGETRFVQGVSAMSASGTYGPSRICAGITGTVDLSLPAKALAEALVRRQAVLALVQPPRHISAALTAALPCTAVLCRPHTP